jgi:hypothetical protein
VSRVCQIGTNGGQNCRTRISQSSVGTTEPPFRSPRLARPSHQFASACGQGRFGGNGTPFCRKSQRLDGSQFQIVRILLLTPLFYNNVVVKPDRAALPATELISSAPRTRILLSRLVAAEFI